MEPWIRRRLVAAATQALSDLPSISVDDGHTRSHRVAIRLHPFQAEREKMAPLRLIVEIHRRFILRDENGIDPTIVIEIAHCEASPHVRGPERRASVFRDIGQPAVISSYK